MFLTIFKKIILICQTLGNAFHLSQNQEISHTFHQNLIVRSLLVYALTNVNKLHKSIPGNLDIIYETRVRVFHMKTKIKQRVITENDDILIKQDDIIQKFFLEEFNACLRQLRL